jgi:photosystem II stability/assembly factor-like uncharacterized protein
MWPRLRWDNVFSVAGFVVVFLSILVSSSFSTGAEQHRAGKATRQQLKMKAIWEPVNYGEDLQLTSVHFSTPDMGWVTGEAGTILYTNDAGNTWKAQLGGDPQASDLPDRRFALR